MSRFGLLLALLLVLLGVGAAVAPGAGVAGDGCAGQHQALRHGLPVIGESASAAPSMDDDLHDWLRLSLVARQAPSTALPDTWWAVRPRATGGYVLRGWLPVGEVCDTGMAAAESTPWPSRAPPVRVNRMIRI